MQGSSDDEAQHHRRRQRRQHLLQVPQRSSREANSTAGELGPGQEAWACVHYVVTTCMA
jgi:hypothetical protein